MRRPIGVVLAAVLLGLMACGLGLMAFFMLLALVMSGRVAATGLPAGPQPPPAFLQGIFIGTSLFYLVLAAWAVATLIGLLRMRNWARYSVVVIGSGLALVGVFGAIGTFMSQAFGAAALPPGQSAQIFHLVIILAVLFELALGAVGVWWIVYFVLGRTRKAFADADVYRQRLTAGSPNAGYAPTPLVFDTAEYGAAPAAPAAGRPAPPFASSTPARPVAVTVVAWLLIVSAIVSIPCALLPLPMFLFGAVMTGWAEHLTFLAIGILLLLTGVGLLRLEKVAFWAACFFYSLGFVNTGLLTLPGYRANMFAYTRMLTEKMSFGMPTPQLDPHVQALMMIPGMIFGVIFCAVILAFLIRNRGAFGRTAQAAT